MTKRYLFFYIAENTGDGFSYSILPVQDLKTITSRRKPTTLVRCVLRSRDIASSEVPCCVNDNGSFKFYDQEDNDLFGDVEWSLSKYKSTTAQNTNESFLPSVLHSEEVVSQISAQPLPIIVESVM